MLVAAQRISSWDSHSFRFTHSENFSNFPFSLLHPLTQFPLYRHHHSFFFFLPCFFHRLVPISLVFSLFSDTEPTEREENVSRQAKFCAALAASSLHKFPQHFPTMDFLSPPVSSALEFDILWYSLQLWLNLLSLSSSIILTSSVHVRP